MSWLNFNDSLNSIKGQLSNFANTVLAEENLDGDNNARTLGETDTVRENKNDDDAFEKDETWRWSTDESKTDQLKTDETITNLKKKILELENENRDLISSLDKLEQNHEENNGELIKIKNKLKEELETVTEKYEVLNMRYNKLALAENGYKKRLNELKNKCENITNVGVKDDDEKKLLEEKIASLEATNKELKDSLNDTNAIIDSKLSEFEANVNRLETENKALKISLQMYKNNEKTTSDYDAKIEKLEDELSKIKIINQNNNIHKNYLTILNDQFFEYFKIPIEDQDSQSTFEDALKNIRNLLKSYETKNALMETRIFELNQNRTDILNEKNEEIERLLQNSEMLTQELLRKSKEIKDLEEECAQLMKNNDLLIGKLSDSKENTLQTIFESNEENVDTLEKEVECANQKIDELQHQLSECQAGPDENFDALKKIIENLEAELKTTRDERDNCRVLIDKMRLDFDVTEYQFSEMNVNLETLSEEIEKHKRKIDALIVENNDLKSSKNDAKSTEELERLIGRCGDLEEKIEEFEGRVSRYLESKEIRIAKCEGVTASRNELQRSLEEAQKKLQDLLDSRNALEAVLRSAQEELQVVKASKDDLQIVLEKTREELQEVAESRNELQISLEKSQSELQALIETRMDLQASQEEAQKNIEEITTTTKDSNDEEVTTSTNELQATVERLQKELQAVTTSRNELQGFLENSQKELQAATMLRKELQESHKNSLEELQVSLKISQKELQAVTASRNELQATLRNSQEELQTITISRNELQASLELLEKELQAVTASRTELQATLRNSQEELQAVTVSRNELQSSLENSQEELQASLGNLQKKLQAVTASRNELQAALDNSQKELQAITASRNELQASLENSQKELQALRAAKNELQTSLKNSQEELQALTLSDNDSIEKKLEELTASRNDLQATLEKSQKDLQDTILSRNELITIVQTKHQETLTYHAEIQRLSEILRTETEKNLQLENQLETMKKTVKNDEEIEKMNDQIVFLREKCNVMAQNILDEQRKGENEKLTFVEKETTLNKNLERLQNHLMEVEEHYTQELLQSEGKIALLQARLNEVEQREKDSSTIYTSVSIRANQQNEALQQQLQSIKNQRDELKKKFMELEDENNVKAAALSNLQLVLEQFQKDKEGDVMRETERIRRQLKHEQKIQDDLRNEITNLESQIKENKQGLQAALRLADQLETSKTLINNLREDINVLNGKLEKKEEELKTIASQTDGKIDKSLIKNLIIGFVTSNNKLNKDQSQILKIIATVLDFNEQEHNRVNLNQTQQSNWLRTFLMPISGDDAPTYDSLSRAFVNFLENESKPRVVPSLLPQQSEESVVSTSSSSTRTTPTPIVLNEIVLPTFSDFPQHRNSSSILKGVLKDNS